MKEHQPEIGPGSRCGEGCVLEEGVVVGRDCAIGHHVVLHAGTIVGDGVRIDDFACVGKLPMKAVNSAEGDGFVPGGAVIGDGCLIGTGAILYAGAALGPRCLVADLATVRENVTVGEGTIVGRGAAIENGCTVGRWCKIETNVYITAHSAIEDGCFIGPCAVTSNDNFAGRSKKRLGLFRGLILRRGGRIGAGAVVLPGREIGPDGFAAAGSVVTKDVPAGVIVAGSPARPLRRVPDDQLLDNQGSDRP